MIVAVRVATVPSATAAASSGRDGGKSWPAMPVRGSSSAASVSRRLASGALIRSRARRNSAVFRYPSSATAHTAAAVTAPPPALTAISRHVPAAPEGASDNAPVGPPAGDPSSLLPFVLPSVSPGSRFHPVSQPPAEPAAMSEPHPADAFSPAAASRRVRSTAAAAMICRYSTVRDRSSTPSANSEASKKSKRATSSAADPLDVRSSASAAATADVYSITCSAGNGPQLPKPAGHRGPWPVGLIRDELSNGFHG